ncbi:hypothetical protein QWY31_00040 [Cytophagales bacterium LB-30]|uniref:Uncharacterized protein n=1 Tax=Shiella aurantiaca TaxID=3058365 RepID=A0ABT8F0Q2_9BACT|nr:hypothetical protein [Shiella aurantiaca]MDN4163863.1 hypothetical protein [Shiella aurantiaca]
MVGSKLSNLDWLKKRCPIQPKKWHTEKVLRINEIENYRFYSRNSTKHYRGIINLADIKGIHYAYAYNDASDITWIDLLNNLKRFKDIRHSNMTYEELIEHAQSDYNESRTVSKFGSLYFTTTGQHRMALCKFLNLEKVTVQINEYTFNHEKYNTYKARKKFIKQLLDRSLISEELSESELMSFEHGINLNIRGVFIMFEDQVFDGIINLYDSLHTNKVLMTFESLIYGKPSPFNNDIRSKSDLPQFKYFLRKCKAEVLSDVLHAS